MSIGDSFRWIDVDLSEQRLIAYQGNEPARSIRVSTGLPRTPTVVGRFKIYVKYKAVRMSGPGYDLPNVPHTMYFYRDYALHGAYWHTNFGRPMSHGCVNLPLPDAEWLYDWASVGTLVVVHE
jgi:lipoprotein-anchoring transpeptidase ErfK/SrfK